MPRGQYDRSKAKPRGKWLRWTCATCGLEQAIRTQNAKYATTLMTHVERDCIDPACKGELRLHVKLVDCDGCGKAVPKTIAGGVALPGQRFCSHRCRGAALDAKA